jgi:uncharacterized protein YukE
VADTEAGFMLAEQLSQSTRELNEATWAEGDLSIKDGALEVLGAILNPANALLSAGVSWLIEHIEPLREAVDQLAGDPAAINAYADAWQAVATKLHSAQERFGEIIGPDTQSWTGEAADAYRTSAREQQGGLAAVAATAEAVAAAVRSAGTVIGSVRDMVREIIVECVSTILSRLPIWLGLVSATLGLALPGIIVDLVMLIVEFV